VFFAAQCIDTSRMKRRAPASKTAACTISVKQHNLNPMCPRPPLNKNSAAVPNHSTKDITNRLRTAAETEAAKRPGNLGPFNLPSIRTSCDSVNRYGILTPLRECYGQLRSSRLHSNLVRTSPTRDVCPAPSVDIVPGFLLLFPNSEVSPNSDFVLLFRKAW
jgi:hypothetical protein